MQLDANICYDALRSRDARFDGKFFTAVLTTGIYCRPVCPARTPHRPNVRFFACAAAAEEAGFRACRRCRPETAPSTPAWQGASVTVARALRLLAVGAGEGHSLVHLAARLGVTDRHLRRLFADHLGASPIAIARTQRIHLARRLIDETTLPMTQIAFAAGFASVRNFNEAVRASFGVSPTELRGRSVASRRPDDSVLRVRLPYRPPLAWESLLEFFARRAVRGVEAVADGVYQRTVRFGESDDAVGRIAVRSLPGQSMLELSLPHAAAASVAVVIEKVRRLFDLGADPLVIATHLGRDPLLAPSLAARPGLRVPGAWDRFEIAVRAVVGQQVSVAGARTILSRLVERCGSALPEGRDGPLSHLFPTPAQLAAADLDKIGMPTARSRALQHLARTVADGELDLACADAEALAQQLCEQPGIGPWTAQYIVMRALGEPDSFLPSDLGVRRALAVAGKMPSVSDAETRAQSWRPWRAYALMHLWAGEA